jgi:hypothetical protein
METVESVASRSASGLSRNNDSEVNAPFEPGRQTFALGSSEDLLFLRLSFRWQSRGSSRVNLRSASAAVSSAADKR